MKRWVRFAGIVGTVLFLFGITGIFLGLSPSEQPFKGDPVLLLHLVLGLGLIIFWATSQGVQSLKGAGAVLGGRTARYGANAVTYAVLFIAILVGINWLAHRHSKRWDLTEQGVYSLAPQSIKVIENLKSPLKIVGFKVVQDTEAMQELLDLFKSANPAKVSISVVDPRQQINLVEKYDMKPGNLIYIEYGEGEKLGVSRINDMTEEALTNAIIKLTRGAAKRIYYITGHEEPELNSSQPNGFARVAAAISDEHLTVQPLLLSTLSKVPEDTAAILLASPKKPMLKEEKDLLVNYAKQGGRLILLGDPRTTGDIKEISLNFGIKVGEDVIIDQQQRLFSAPALGAQPVVQTYEMAHPITEALGQSSVTIFNVASSVTVIGQPKEGENFAELAKTSGTSWAETDLAGIFDSSDPTADKGPSDIAGPVTLAVAYEQKVKSDQTGTNDQAKGDSDTSATEKTTRVVVFGDTDWVLNANIDVYANRDLLMNAINWTAGEEGGLSIRPRSLRASSADLSRGAVMTMLRGSLIIPELLLILGLFIWWNRRSELA